MRRRDLFRPRPTLITIVRSPAILPAEETDRIWQCLESADPIFTRELPNTSNALKFYSTNIDRCIEIHGQQDAHVRASVACDVHGNAAQIVFDILPRQPLPVK